MATISFRQSKTCTTALFCLLLGMAATTARRGPDFTAYRDWVDVLVRADMEELASTQRSPRGHKLTQWLAGPALPYALPKALAFDAVRADTSLIVMGAVAALAGAGLLAGLLRRLSVERAATIFWFAAAWVAMPIGYYLTAFSAETVAVWLVVLLVGAFFDPERRSRSLVIGLATSLLLMTRPYWVLYALPALAGVARDLVGRSPRRLVGGAIALAAPVAAAVVQLALVNRWTTGDVRRFAYLFGDFEFQSLDLAHPEWGAVLWHPLHGLLVYHPAVGLGFAAMLALVFRAPSWGERAAWGAFAAVVAVNVYVQASWYCWWQGTGITFGMRGLVPAAVPAIAALARLVQRESSPVVRHGLVLATTICGIWSWLMLLPGPTDYVSYGALLDGMKAVLDTMLDPRFIFLAMPGLFLLCLAAALFGSRPDGKLTSIVPASCAATLVSLWSVYVWTQWMLGPDFFGWLDPKRDPFLADSSPAWQIAIVGAVALVAGGAAFLATWFAIDGRRLAERLTALAVVAGFGVFAVAAYRIETGPTRIPARPPTYPGKLYYVPEVWATWDDYQRVPGFDGAKSRLRNFMIREGIPLDVSGDLPPDGDDQSDLGVPAEN